MNDIPEIKGYKRVIGLILAAVLIIPLVIGRVKRMKWEVIIHEHSKIRK
jgi:hypothetical protein